jgi:hypothetical protein
MADTEYTRDQNLQLVWNTLMFFACESSYTMGERTGGVLQGCPRKPPPSPDELAGYAQIALAALCRFVGREPEDWMLAALPSASLGEQLAPVLTHDEIDAFYEAWEFSEEDPGRLEFHSLVRETEYRVLARVAASPASKSAGDPPEWRTTPGRWGGPSDMGQDMDDEDDAASKGAGGGGERARPVGDALTLSVDDLMRVVRSNWGDMAAIEAAFRANLSSTPSDQQKGGA